MFLVQLRSNLEEIINPKLNHFLSYEELDISPQQVFKSKKEHELALFELSKGLSNLLNENNQSII